MLLTIYAVFVSLSVCVSVSLSVFFCISPSVSTSVCLSAVVKLCLEFYPQLPIDISGSIFARRCIYDQLTERMTHCRSLRGYNKRHNSHSDTHGYRAHPYITSAKRGMMG